MERLFVKLTARMRPPEERHLTFSSPNSFTLATKQATKSWDGTIEYSTDAVSWSIWDGATTLSAADGKLYIRGLNNTQITGAKTAQYNNHNAWVLAGSDISCSGSIENLLDYKQATYYQHPTMDAYCFKGIFASCTSLTTAPELPATTLAEACYFQMFKDCTGLTTAPELPATTLAASCYKSMFYGCTSLTTAPELPATVVANSCYAEMFQKCTNLETLPALPATDMGFYCYNYMFADCTKIKLSTTQTDEYQNPYRIPTTGDGKEYNGDSRTNMFLRTGGTFTGTPTINTTYYTSNTIV